ncbi:MAG: glycosyltransferase family 4 protein [Chloroflexi bacterium]|nr:glycosyltransferase family 4 protein [Chloroflexota bacterium]
MFAIDARYIQDHFPGIGRYTYNLIDALARVAPDERFVVLHNPALRNTRYDITALVRHPNVELCRVDVPTFSMREQFALLSSRGASTRHRPYVLHSPYFIKPYFLRVRSVVTIFDLIPLHFPSDVPSRRARLFFRWAVRLAARTAARIIVPSASTCNDLHVRLGVPREKIAVIPLAADERFAPQPSAEIARVREKYALPSDYCLYVGINKPHKNLATLIAAWQRVERKGALVIAGAWDARYAEEQEQAGGQGSKGAGEIRFIHDVGDKDLPALYAGAACFVMPSFCEGFGLTPLEAMACGAPVIASNTSSLPEVVGDAALLFDPRDANALAALLTRVLNDVALQAELRAKSLARVAQFSWERTANDTLRVYHTLGERCNGPD